MTTRTASVLLASVLALVAFSGETEANRGSGYGAATYHVEVDCLGSTQVERLEDAFHGARGAVSFDDISSRCVVEMAPAGAGVSPFTPCDSRRLSDCVLPAVASIDPDGFEMLTVINPDSMDPACLVGANPTPHP